MRRFTRTCRVNAGGFTLLELMIVLALLALLVAIAWPSLSRPLLRSATQQAARQLATDLARARLNAIDTQRTMVVRYEPGAARYTIVPADTISDTSQANSSQGTFDDELTALDVSDESSTREDLEITAQLPEDVVFQDPADAADDEIPADSTLGRLLSDERQQTEEVKPLVQDDKDETNWSHPILVYPTGRAENAQFVLLGPDGYRVTVTLRGLTGAVTIGPLAHELRTTDEAAGQEMPATEPAPPPLRQSPESADFFRKNIE